VNNAADVLDSVQHRAREYWVEVGGRLHPGWPARMSRSQAGPRPAAPGGDDQRPAAEPLGWPGGVSGDDQPLAAEPLGWRGGAARRSGRAGLAFDGLRVADFTWVAAGPMSAKALADHGATVVKIESGARPDLVRLLPPFLHNLPGPNRSQWMGNLNTSKLSLALNLATPRGRELARRIVVEWADVVMDSYTPGTMARLGLGHDDLAAARPDLICFSTSLMGDGGPLSPFAGYGNHGAAIAGMTHLTGWPGLPPAGPSGPYSDIVTPRFAVALLAAAVLDRRRTGAGIRIDLSQVECAARFLEPVLLDAAVNGRVADPAGHASRTACPSGVYACTGVERYVTLAVESADQWRALCDVLAMPDLRTPDLDDPGARRTRAAEIDARITAWTSGLDRFEAEARLVEAGVPAAAVLRASDLHRDAQLAHRGFFVPLEHGEMGTVPYDGFATRFSARPGTLRGPAPLLGQHTREVLSSILGLTEGEIDGLAEEGVLT
jgi:benzylsuccinate CoA-transferase BbsF subunit